VSGFALQRCERRTIYPGSRLQAFGCNRV